MSSRVQMKMESYWDHPCFSVSLNVVLKKKGSYLQDTAEFPRTVLLNQDRFSSSTGRLVVVHGRDSTKDLHLCFVFQNGRAKDKLN